MQVSVDHQPSSGNVVSEMADNISKQDGHNAEIFQISDGRLEERRRLKASESKVDNMRT